MNILITGGLGYIGGRLTDYLLKKNNHEITITTFPGKYKIPHRFKNAKIHYINISDKQKLIEICKDIDYIIHLVATNEIVSGKYPISHGIINHGSRVTTEEIRAFKRTGTILLPEILKARGYTTVAVDWLGRWHRRGYTQYGVSNRKFRIWLLNISKDNLTA